MAASDHLSGHQFGNPYFPHRGSKDKRDLPVQGKLFREPKPVDANRYPRGYTPERMREVNAMPLSIHQAQPRRGVKAGTDPFSDYGGPDRIKQTIARSTIPADSIKPRYYGDQLTIEPASKEVRRGSWAHYKYLHGGGGYGEVHLGGGSTEQKMGQSLMHELGHARSELEATPHARPATRQHLGQEEAFADDYMMSHWRPDPRDVRKGKATTPVPGYEGPESFKGVPVPAYNPTVGVRAQTGGKTAAKAYAAARKTPSTRDARLKQYAAERRDASFQSPLHNEEFSPTSWGLKKRSRGEMIAELRTAGRRGVIG